MKSELDDVPIHEMIRPRNQTSQKKKLIAFIKKQKDKKLELHGYKKKRKLIGYSEGEWSLRQLKLYHRYLSAHKNQFTDPQLRKRNKVFIKLADFIGSRTPDQSRSHHQKATCKFQDFEMLLANYETKIFHLSRLYDDVNQASLRENERNRQKRIREEEHQFLIRGGAVNEEKGEVEEYKSAKLEENEQIYVVGQGKVGENRVDKVTVVVETQDFFRYWIEDRQNKMRIEIDEGAMQIFK